MSHRSLSVSPFLRRPLVAATLVALGACAGSAIAGPDTGVDVIQQKDVNSENGTDIRHITFIHTSDLHGDFHPHDNSRDSQPVEGGLARVFTVVDSIRQSSQNPFYVHTGDTIQGSAEALFTNGQAMIDVMNAFGIQAFAPGNWEFVYGVKRFRDVFLGNGTTAPLANWGISAVNAYYNGQAGRADDTAGTYGATNAGKLLVTPYSGKPYRVQTIDGVKVGIFGCTTNRGPQIVGSNVTAGITYTNCKGQVAAANNNPIAWPTTGPAHENADPTAPTNGLKTKPEIPRYVNILRSPAGVQVVGEPAGVMGEGVDMVILLSEGGLAENIYNAQTNSGIDIIFSSDMHEETNYPVEVTTPNGGKTLVIEEGEDGAQVGELAFKLKKTPSDATFVVDSWKWKEHDVTGSVVENEAIEALIDTATKPFRSAADGGTFVAGAYTNPFSGAKLMAPLGEVVGTTQIEISRNRYSHEWDESNGVMPGVIEGTGHAIITDAFRVVTDALLTSTEKADGKPLVGAIRGFRYVNSYPAGSALTYEDLYHFLSIGPQVAVTEMTVGALNNQSESAADSCMNPDVTAWAGGWMFNFSGVTFDLNPYSTNVQVSAGTGPKLSSGRISNFRLGQLSVNDNSSTGTLIDDSAKDQAGSDADKTKRIRYASYYYETSAASARQVNNIFPAGVTATTGNTPIRKIMRLKGTNFGEFAGLELVRVFPTPTTADVDYKDLSLYDRVDATEVVAVYIKEFLTDATITAANTPFPRIHLTEALPDTRETLGFPTIEPVFGADKNDYYPIQPAAYSNGQIDQD